jgi:hypothetical protein
MPMAARKAKIEKRLEPRMIDWNGPAVELSDMSVRSDHQHAFMAVCKKMKSCVSLNGVPVLEPPAPPANRLKIYSLDVMTVLTRNTHRNTPTDRIARAC